jgi:transglutaminase-like putative cysteine protease
MGDSISPGSISELVRSRAVAFRADFEGPLPAPPQRYWRGLVLWQTDGRNWTQGETGSDAASGYRGLGTALEYHVTLEPTQQRWLYALDLPAAAPGNAVLTPDFLLLRKEPVSRRMLYRASSYLSYNTGDLPQQERFQGLQLPGNITPRMVELVQTWRRESSDDLSLVNHALRHFREEAFYYTLYPPLLSSNPVDQFLFDSRRGFCEHYASSFATLMRLAGIPARVVIGYQGGERNPMGDYLIIRQSDAHAWTEVWLQGRGWTRIDPTAAVAPERIERSFDFDLDEIATPIGTPVRFNVESDLLKSLARQLRWGMDAVNASWHRWVLGYTRERQSHLMEMLGLGFLKGHKLGIGMVIATAIVVLLLGFYIWRKGRLRLDPVQVDYLRFCARLKKRGLPRHSFEGPADYGRRVARRWPQQSETTNSIIRLYIQLRYGKGDSAENRNRFHRLVREFRG